MRSRSTFFQKLRTYTVLPFRVSAVVLCLSYLLLLIAELSTSAADVLNNTVCQGLRSALATLTSPFPFSFGEWVLLLAPTALTFTLAVLFVRCHTAAARVRLLSFVLSVVCTLASMHILTLGIAYRTTPLDRTLGITREVPTEAELYDTAAYLVACAERELDAITFGESGSSVMPYSAVELSEKLCDAYARVNGQYGVPYNLRSRVKMPMASKALSYAHLLGIYSFYTGEANVNADYPSYNFPATAAHEFAHQRGIIREDEANFMAHLVCIASDDAYIRYSGYTHLLIYVLNACYRVSAYDSSIYADFYKSIDVRIRREFYAENLHSEQYDTAFGEVSSSLNDLYLQANGTDGAVSYGYVVDMAVAFYKNRR